MLADGTYIWKFIGKIPGPTVVMYGRIANGQGPTVEFCMGQGDTFEPAVVLTQAEYDALQAKVAQPATPAIPAEVRESLGVMLHYFIDRADDIWVWYSDDEMHALDSNARRSAIDVREWLEAQKEATGD